MFSFFQRQKETAKKIAASLFLYLLIKLIHCFNEIARFNPRTNRIDTLLHCKNNVLFFLFFKTIEHVSYDRTPIFWTTNPNLNTVKLARTEARNNTLDSVMSSGTALLTKTNLSNRQIHIIINNQQVFNSNFKIIHQRTNRFPR